ncbi:MAG TPA: HoxN/HupN/NixA family nickel/cobalt transporter [Stellaceae bacterium]|jgi:high-affinity nickel-transport protein|nr:HoxN/HupN/NixA family nickel/cobalt transporter [Stellaceae bacterium]
MTIASLASIFSDRPRSLRATALGLALVIGGANLLAWFWALIAFHDFPVLLGTAFLAYGFGLRHAVDADHIAAIDNATRKLMQGGKRPAALGFYFALGHSTVVVVASIAVAATAGWLRQDFPRLQEVGGVVGTGISALFLLAVAIVNLFIFAAVWKSFRSVRAGGKLGAGELDTMLAGRGFLARLLRPLFRLVTRSWHMFAVGLLFGLGFDTATEIGLLGIAASEAAHGLSLWATLVFPALFTAGMCLIDTADSVLMVGAYGWALAKPVRKLYYNLTITFASVVVALLIGSVELLGIAIERLGLTGPFWDAIGALNDNFGSIGYVVLAIFIVSWLGSMLIYRLKGYGTLDTEIEAAP